MNFKEIQELIRLVSKSDLSEFKLKEADFELTIKTGKAIKQSDMPMISYAHPQPHPALTAPPVSPHKPTADEEAARVVSEAKGKFLEIKSPMVGTFYRSPGPDKAVFVKIGDRVDSGTTVCIIEAMKLFNEIESEVKGTIVKVLVEDASPVEYDQVLFLVEP